ncbi:MAG: hypothetical protein JWM47_1873 [Acidimicrobiales bacterium]|nr:hypothetical protein [Acidimicrobiales bacterium]
MVLAPGSHLARGMEVMEMAFQVTEVQKVLKGASYPARGPDLAEVAKSNGADEEQVQALADIDVSCPDRTR